MKFTNALKIIDWWIDRYKPWFADCLNPGLSITEIDNLVQEWKLPCELPKEFYELYQWHNGAIIGDLTRDTAWVFNNWTFLPLQELIERREKDFLTNPVYDNFPIYQKPILPIFYNQVHCREIGGILMDNSLEDYPVIFYDGESGLLGIIKKYASLNSMMQTIAECYSTGVYYHNSEDENQFYVRSNIEQERKIWLKYNSAIIDSYLQFFQSFFEKVNLRKQEPILDICQAHDLLTCVSEDLIRFKDYRSVEPLIKILHIFGQWNHFEAQFALTEAIKILGEIGDKRETKIITEFIKSENNNVRSIAQTALAKLC